MIKNFPLRLLMFLLLLGGNGELQGQNAADIGSYAAPLFFARTTLNEIEDFSETGLESGHSWMSALQYVDHEVKGEAGRPVKSTYQGSDIFIGYFQEIQDMNLGLTLSVTDINTDSTPDAGNNNAFINEIQGDGWNLSLAAAKQWGPWSWFAVLGTGSQSLDGIRRFTEDSPNPPLPKASAFDVSTFSARTSLRYTWLDDEQWKIPFYLATGYDLLEADGFEEVDITGNAGDDVVLEAFEDSVPFVELGVIFIYQAMEGVTPELQLALVQDLGEDIIDLPWTNGPFSVVSEVNDPTQTSIYGRFSLDFELSESWYLKPVVDYISSDHYSGVSGSLFLSYQF